MNNVARLLKAFTLQLLFVSCFQTERVSQANQGTTAATTNKFVSTWRTTTSNETITLPLRSGYSYNITVDWGDGSSSTITSASSSNKTHTYATAGDYQVTIIGSAEAWYQNNTGDKAKLISVEEFGDLGWNNLKGAFHGATNLESFNVSGSISNVINTASMFEGASSITSLDICGLDTSRVYDMSNMFKDVSSLTTFDTTCLNTEDAIFLAGLFYNMSSLTSLDISNLNLSKVENMDNTFRGMGTVDINFGPIEEKPTPNLTSSYNIFTATTATLTCSALGMNGFGSFLGQPCSGVSEEFFTTRWYVNNGWTVTLPLVSGYNYDFYIDWGDGTISEITSHDDPDKTHTYSLTGVQYVTMRITGTCEAWNFITSGAGKNYLHYVDNLGEVGWLNLEGAFSGAELRSAKINHTESVTNMRHMLSSNTKLTSIDLTEIDTSNVTDMGFIFTETRPTALNLSNFDTSNVTKMESMFRRIPRSFTLDLSSFDTSNVTDMSNMFNDFRGSSAALDLSNFDTSNVTNMSGMFEMWGYDSDAQTGTIDLSSFDTSNVTNMAAMFRGREYISSLDLSGFNTSNVTDMSYMFSDARSLTNINANNWDISAVSNSSMIFFRTGIYGGPLVLHCDQVSGNMFSQACH
ncbi:MAG: BspA family leucine-rich repeat surface protein [Bacteriovoracaceae bacterium]